MLAAMQKGIQCDNRTVTVQPVGTRCAVLGIHSEQRAGCPSRQARCGMHGATRLHELCASAEDQPRSIGVAT